jgi:hypothetical protein
MFLQQATNNEQPIKKHKAIRLHLSLALFIVFTVTGLAQITAPIDAVISAAGTNMRACSGLNCPRRAKLAKGTRCKIIKTERLESLINYGVNTWAEISTENGYRGFVYSALLQITPPDKTYLRADSNAVIITDAFVRTCPNRKCDILFRVVDGASVRTLARTRGQTILPNQRQAYFWYFIDYRGKRGFIHGSLLSFVEQVLFRDQGYAIKDTIHIIARQAEVVNAYGQPIRMAYQGESFPVLQRSLKSELVRPFGRHYKYKVKLDNSRDGWVFGAFTSERNAPVDCQCVDFVKHKLNISGPTKNAFEWDEVLLGKIPITINGQKQYLLAEEITSPRYPQINDIAVFDNTHPQVHPQYGHIGIVDKIGYAPDGSLRKVLIEGGNHQDPIQEGYYPDERCNNISKKWYMADQNVRFFRLR